jgi:hypothetical protein
MLQILTNEIGEKWIQPELFLVPTPQKSCADCNAFDSSIPDANPWKFCLLKGKYISEQDLKTCKSFKPIIPYQAPPKKRRSPGQGSGYIQLHYCEKQTKSGKKSYEQYYYHYELEQGGKRVKRSVYIPKNKLNRVQEWERKKVPVTNILSYLGKLSS